FGGCGGCALQHWAEAPYLAWKTELLRAALVRAGFAAPNLLPIHRASPGTRRRMDLALLRDRGGVAVGLHPAHGGRPIDLASCPMLDPALAALIAPIRALLARGAWLRREGSAIANLLDTGPDLLLRTDAAPGPAERIGLVAFARRHGLARLSWAKGAGSAETVAELRKPRLALGGVEVSPPPGAFLQATQAGEAAIRAAVLNALPPDLSPRARIEELHAGLGTLSFALAARARVRAWDASEAAIGALRAGAARAGLAGRIETTVRDLARRPLTPAELAGAAAVVLDPPHAGAAAQMGALAAAGPPSVIYVSCNPATLARDAAILRDGGYALERAVPIDQFLFSSRLEAVALFRRPR
ncbi:MAG: class I SAM-dependent RNA methyltransferase, partial [Rhodospirillales bacterium]|nr:class I SAM-dependent RNA methyltransferase [Rhodospirillales bacterium]